MAERPDTFPVSPGTPNFSRKRARSKRGLLTQGLFLWTLSLWKLDVASYHKVSFGIRNVVDINASVGSQTRMLCAIPLRREFSFNIGEFVALAHRYHIGRRIGIRRGWLIQTITIRAIGASIPDSCMLEYSKHA
jgi:hypothetical protein